MIAILFLVAVGAVIGLGIGYGLGHVAGMAEGWRQGRAAVFDARLTDALGAGVRLREHREELVRPVGGEGPFDFEESEGRR